MKALIKFAVIGVWAVLATACTVKNQDAPPLTGPSEFGTSITVEASPDILPTDGGSQSRITITARDANGQPLRNLSLRTEILVDGVPTDFGTLSARSVVTDANGRATVVYTAPAVNGGVDTGATVAIGVTPIGTDAASSIARTAAIRLVPVGVVIGPAGLTPSFTFSPTTATMFEPVFFDASASTSSPTNPIVNYRWEFSDGTVLSGRRVTKTFETPGDKAVRLVISDAFGREAATTRIIQVDAVSGPNAQFTISPSDPRVGEDVFVNASGSTVPPGRRIVSYVWDFGNGQRGEGVTASVRYSAARTYNITLTITDDTGRTDTEIGQVSVSASTLR